MTLRFSYEGLAAFRKHILALIRPSTNITFHYHNPKGSKLIDSKTEDKIKSSYIS